MEVMNTFSKDKHFLYKKWSFKHRTEDEARLLTSSILLLDSILLLSIIIYYKLVLYLLKKSSVIAPTGIPQFIK